MTFVASKKYSFKIPFYLTSLTLVVLLYCAVPLLQESVKAVVYYLSCSNRVCTYVDSSGTPSYVGDSSVTPPTITAATPSCLEGKPIVNLTWTNSPTGTVTWTHFDRFEVPNPMSITTTGGGARGGRPPGGIVISTTSPVQIDLGYAGSAPVPDTTAMDSHLIPYASYVPLKESTTYVYSLRAQNGPGNPPQGLQSPPSNVFLVTTLNCGPGPFSQNLPVAYCQNSITPKIDVSWTASQWATDYQVFYYDPSDNSTKGGWTTGGATSYSLDSSSGLVVGRPYGFIIRALNQSAATSQSDNGQWGHEKFGTFTTFPDCVPPGAFSLTSGPTANCPAVDSPNVTLSWGPPGSSGATNYHVLYRDTADNVTREFPSSWYYRGNTVFSETVTGLTPGNNYGFLIAASKCSAANCPPLYNSFQSYSGNWTDVTPGATTYPKCSLPIVNLFLTSPDFNNGQRKPHDDLPYMSLKQTQSATISWETSNANTNCTASIPAQLLGSGKPTPQNIIQTWVGSDGSGSKPNSGSQVLPQLITTGTYPFTLTCYNPWNNNLTTSSKINLIVEQLQKPYIQTTGGSVHTNESISIPQN